MSPEPPTTRADPLRRVGAALLACAALGALLAAVVLAVFFLAYSGEGEGTSGPDGVAIALSAAAGAAAAGCCVAIAWLARLALTGNAARPSWRLWLGAVLALPIGFAVAGLILD